MINSGHEEEAHQETEVGSQAQAGAVQRGAKESVGGEEITEEMISRAVVAELTEHFSPHGRDERVINRSEAEVFAEDIIERITLMRSQT